MAELLVDIEIWGRILSLRLWKDSIPSVWSWQSIKSLIPNAALRKINEVKDLPSYVFKWLNDIPGEIKQIYKKLFRCKLCGIESMYNELIGDKNELIAIQRPFTLH